MLVETWTIFVYSEDIFQRYCILQLPYRGTAIEARGSPMIATHNHAQPPQLGSCHSNVGSLVFAS
jgi:hypothetical protein